MTPDTQAPYKEIIHDVLATNYQVSRNEAPSEDADEMGEALTRSADAENSSHVNL